MRNRDGDLIPVDDERNLQVLCQTCNRNKRDQGSFDFRPTEERLIEALAGTLQIAGDLGLDVDIMVNSARLRYEDWHSTKVPSPKTKSPILDVPSL